MERDFLGLNSKDGCIDHGSTGFIGNAGMQWAFSNKLSALPQFMSFKPTQEERMKKMRTDQLTSSGFQSYQAFDCSHKPPSSGVTQKTINFDRPSAHFAMPGYPVHGLNEMRTFPVSNHSIPVATSNHPFIKIHGAGTGPSSAATSVKQQQQQQQPLGGIPVKHGTFSMMGSMAGTYAQRNISKPVPALAPLTIFYNGVVKVYNEVPLEKAQAIMFLAGNGPSMTANASNPRTQVQAMTPKPVVADRAHMNQSHTTSPRSSLSSPTSVTSHTGTQSGSGSSNTDEVPAKALEAGLPPKIVVPIESAAGTPMPAAVPQARKASLARFLEKRKERLISVAPFMKKSPDSAFLSGGGAGAGAGFAYETSTAYVAQSWFLRAN